MEVQIGSIVKSTAGRDKNSFYVVVDIKEEFVYICDGKIRRLENIKKKNIRHISKTNQTVEQSSLKTNKQVKNALKHLNNSGQS